ncbi:MAG: glycosyltransferase [Patescibacteria group bacterium]|nr:glycosyltransferase [Patescibacteria group bacterium]MDE1946129.1 glycosyltransferase [Patescibacteria group bacterium]
MSDVATILTQIAVFLGLYFEVFMLIAFLGDRKKKNAAFAATEYPSVTITVPVWNEEKTVFRTVESLLALDYPKDKLSIFIIDDGSTDDTWNIIQAYKDNPQVKLFHKENGGKHTAVNYAIEHATSDLFGCLDADSFVEPNALRLMADHFRADPDVMAVTPSLKIWNPNSIVRHLQSSEYHLGVFRKETQSRIGAIFITPGPFSIYRMSVFAQIGRFKSAHNTEDMEIAMRMQKNRLKIENAREAIVYTVGPATVRTLHKQRVRWLYGLIRNGADYREFFFNPKYGHVGMFFFPTSAALMAVAIFYFFKILFSLGSFLLTKISELHFLGANPSLIFQNVRFSWFFVNLPMTAFIDIALILFTIGMVVYGRYLTEKRIRIDASTIAFPFLYPVFAIFWVLRSAYNAAIAKKPSWR